MCIQKFIPRELNTVSETISYALNVARKCVEGACKQIECAPEKIKKETILKHIKSLIRKKKVAEQMKVL